MVHVFKPQENVKTAPAMKRFNAEIKHARDLIPVQIAPVVSVRPIQ
jgi:hypothetical protein